MLVLVQIFKNVPEMHAEGTPEGACIEIVIPVVVLGAALVVRMAVDRQPTCGDSRFTVQCTSTGNRTGLP